MHFEASEVTIVEAMRETGTTFSEMKSAFSIMTTLVEEP
jgi:hypothetical protein